jgi:hypothetical protein
MLTEQVGKYRATDKAKALYQEDPELTHLGFELIPQGVKKENGEEPEPINPYAFLDWETIANRANLTTILHEQQSYSIEELGDLREPLLPLVMIYLIQNGHYLPELTGGEPYSDEYRGWFTVILGKLHEQHFLIKEGLAF